MLTERQQRILNAIINDYIRSAEPVGSRTISKLPDIAFSPATIRNEMSDLEELGFLEQPHTSAGRIPSNKGYRYYVDHLINLEDSLDRDSSLSRILLEERIQEMGRVMQQVAQILSHLTSYTSIVLGPEMFNASLRHIQLLSLSESRAVAIIVTSTGRVENRTVEVPQDIPLEDIEKVVAILNDKLRGVPLYQLRQRLHREIDRELKQYIDHCEQAMSLVEGIFIEDEGEDDTSRLFLSGITNMLAQPEFKDLEKLKGLMELFDETPMVRRLFAGIPKGLQVKIGNENHLDVMAGCSFITASFHFEDTPLGMIGVLGPTRMDYERVIGLLRHLSRDLPQVMARWYT